MRLSFTPRLRVTIVIANIWCTKLVLMKRTQSIEIQRIDETQDQLISQSLTFPTIHNYFTLHFTGTVVSRYSATWFSATTVPYIVIYGTFFIALRVALFRVAVGGDDFSFLQS